MVILLENLINASLLFIVVWLYTIQTNMQALRNRNKYDAYNYECMRSVNQQPGGLWLGVHAAAIATEIGRVPSLAGSLAQRCPTVRFLQPAGVGCTCLALLHWLAYLLRPIFAEHSLVVVCGIHRAMFRMLGLVCI